MCIRDRSWPDDINSQQFKWQDGNYINFHQPFRTHEVRRLERRHETSITAEVQYYDDDTEDWVDVYINIAKGGIAWAAKIDPYDPEWTGLIMEQ